MSQKKILHILQQVQDGTVSPEEAMLQLKMEPFQDLGFAKVDHHRELRQGTAEVIYGAGKTTEQINRAGDLQSIPRGIQRHGTSRDHRLAAGTGW